MNDMSQDFAPDSFAAGAGPADPPSLLSELLTRQALSLDAMFTDLIGHAADTMTEWPVAAQAYARLAFRAQSNCRTSLEAADRATRADRAARESDGTPRP